MTRPAVEVADILRAQGNSFLDRHRGQLRFQQLKVMRAILRCRTAALGGHIDRCLRCGKDWGLSFNSCRDRHCPKCQAQSRQRWIAARQQELLATPYFHVVFTLPHLLNALIRQNPVELYNLLFRSMAETLMEVAANPKHLGAEIGFFRSCTRGARISCFILTSIVSFHLEAWRPVAHTGYVALPHSSYPWRCFSRFSAESSSTDWSRPLLKTA